MIVNRGFTISGPLWRDGSHLSEEAELSSRFAEIPAHSVVRTRPRMRMVSFRSMRGVDAALANPPPVGS
jgi:hypothetical protein